MTKSKSVSLARRASGQLLFAGTCLLLRCDAAFRPIVPRQKRFFRFGGYRLGGTAAPNLADPQPITDPSSSKVCSNFIARNGGAFDLVLLAGDHDMGSDRTI